MKKITGFGVKTTNDSTPLKFIKHPKQKSLCTVELIMKIDGVIVSSVKKIIWK